MLSILILLPILCVFLEILNLIMNEFIQSVHYDYEYSLEFTGGDLSETLIISIIPILNFIIIGRFVYFSVCSALFGASKLFKNSLNMLDRRFSTLFGGKHKVLFKIGKKNG